MRTIEFVPGAIGAGANITIPATAPDIQAVVSAEITRLPTGMGVQDHAAAAVVAAFGNHTQAQVIGSFGNHTQAAIVAAFADHAAAAVIAGVANHTQANIVAAIVDHAVHAHDLLVTVAAAAEAYGASGVGVADLESITGQTIPAAGAAGGCANNAAAQAHGAGGAAVAHAAGAVVAHAAGAALAHAAGVALAHVAGVAVAHGAAADPVTAAVPTIGTTRIITLSVNTVLGDVLILNYLEVGEVVLTT